MKPLSEMSTEEARLEILRLRERRLQARQAEIDAEKVVKEKKPPSEKKKRPSDGEMDSELGSLLDSLLTDGGTNESLDRMLKNLENL